MRSVGVAGKWNRHMLLALRSLDCRPRLCENDFCVGRWESETSRLLWNWDVASSVLVRRQDSLAPLEGRGGGGALAVVQHAEQWKPQCRVPFRPCLFGSVRLFCL